MDATFSETLLMFGQMVCTSLSLLFGEHSGKGKWWNSYQARTLQRIPRTGNAKLILGNICTATPQLEKVTLLWSGTEIKHDDSRAVSISGCALRWDGLSPAKNQSGSWARSKHQRCWSPLSAPAGFFSWAWTQTRAARNKSISSLNRMDNLCTENEEKVCG